MRISTLSHWALVSDFVLNGAIDSSVFFGWAAASGYQDLVWAERDGRGALVELGSAAVRQLFYRPFIFIDVIAKADLRVHIVSEKINPRRLILGTLQQEERKRFKNIKLNNLEKNTDTDTIISSIIHLPESWMGT